MPEITAILWDLDGVLADTASLHFRSWMHALSFYGIPFDWQTFHRTFGMNNAGIVRVAMDGDPGPELIAEISQRKEVFFCEAAHGAAELLPGARALLEAFHCTGLLQAVASSAPRGSIDFLMDELGIRQFFAALVSGFDLPGRPSKPDPAVFLEAALQLGCQPAGCMVIEDALVGIEAARRAGMACLAVATTHPIAQLSGAQLALDRLDSLPPSEIMRRFNTLTRPDR